MESGGSIYPTISQASPVAECKMRAWPLSVRRSMELCDFATSLATVHTDVACWEKFTVSCSDAVGLHLLIVCAAPDPDGDSLSSFYLASETIAHIPFQRPPLHLNIAQWTENHVSSHDFTNFFHDRKVAVPQSLSGLPFAHSLLPHKPPDQS
jgi:hypothetical protein